MSPLILEFDGRTGRWANVSEFFAASNKLIFYKNRASVIVEIPLLDCYLALLSTCCVIPVCGWRPASWNERCYVFADSRRGIGCASDSYHETGDMWHKEKSNIRANLEREEDKAGRRRGKERRKPWTNIFSIDSGHTSAPLPSLRSFLCLRWGVRDL